MYWFDKNPVADTSLLGNNHNIAYLARLKRNQKFSGEKKLTITCRPTISIHLPYQLNKQAIPTFQAFKHIYTLISNRHINIIDLLPISDFNTMKHFPKGTNISDFFLFLFVCVCNKVICMLIKFKLSFYSKLCFNSKCIGKPGRQALYKNYFFIFSVSLVSQSVEEYKSNTKKE